MCIYLLDQPDLHYDSAEHVIPAGLGGIKKLPLDYVSREFNNLSSKHERALMRSSILALPRQILGPGKRGSMNPNKATKSSVSVFSQQTNGKEFSLGYIQAGIPHEIPHIVWPGQGNEVTINIAKEASDSEVNDFKLKLAAFDENRVRMIPCQHLDDGTFLLGVKGGLEQNIDFYIASKNGNTHPFTINNLAALSKLIINKSTFTNHESYHASTHQTATIGDDYYKCCAKIAFNTLAHIKGKEFALQECFNPLRNWIVNGGDNQFVTLAPSLSPDIQRFFPVDSHQIIITKSREGLVADICFYNHFRNRVRLTSYFSESFPSEGFICDWQAKQEFGYHEYLARRLYSQIE